MSRSGNRSILVLLVSDEEPSLPVARDSQHSTPSTQTLIRDVVQPPALTSQQPAAIVSLSENTVNIFHHHQLQSSAIPRGTVGGGASSWI